jgi:hypothetical protein
LSDNFLDGGLVERIKERRGATGVWWVNLREIIHLEEPDVERRMILKFVFWK